ncbi:MULTISPECIES: hypothetical protein [Pseudomonas]|uniref:hypothetical protein n=1 Tax=Pseudomonas TaxID=286 RepID=UPI0013C40A5A|nr:MULTISPECIES: hypothetical protein [Pseudomonas]MDP2145131.1 hypothetical protein [Pseudomonas sp.]MBJ2242089.1 hypothetical protein [Pseudomonas sp. MF6768]MBK3454213.1 hypothetical protein [Pseudomonas sp. MF6754]MCM8562939.1 hypothetical protein [Pseudomonas shahriarae]QXH88320.1 hypothetical protein HU773_022110 [Pseudomonas shahriarae]
METIKNLEFASRKYSECSYEYLVGVGVPVSIIDEALVAQHVVAAQQVRRAAYIAEADPLYLEWQYDQKPASEKVWRDKVADIKARFPLPEDK